MSWAWLFNGLSDLNEANFLFVQLFCKVGVSLHRIIIIHIIVSRARWDFNSNLIRFKILKSDINQLKGKSASVGCWPTVLIGSFVWLWSQKLINQVSVGSVEFNSIKSCLLGELYTISPLFLSKFNFVQSHLMWDFMINFHPRMLISNSKAWRSPCLKPTVREGECSSSAMIYLNVNQTVFLMDCFIDSFPSFCLGFRIQIASTWKSIASLTPGGRLGQQKPCFGSLRVVLDEMVIGNSGLDVAPDSGQSWKDDSIFEDVFS